MIDLSSALITTFTGIIGVGVGAIISNFVNQKIARQAIKKDLIFKKKVEYFEKIVHTMGTNIQLYKNTINQLESQKNKKSIKNVLKNLKTNRQKFEMTTGPLFMDTRSLSMEIKKFVGIEKLIFKYLEKASLENNSPEELIRNLKINFRQIRRIGNNLIIALRHELVKE